MKCFSSLMLLSPSDSMIKSSVTDSKQSRFCSSRLCSSSKKPKRSCMCVCAALWAQTEWMQSTFRTCAEWSGPDLWGWMRDDPLPSHQFLHLCLPHRFSCIFLLCLTLLKSHQTGCLLTVQRIALPCQYIRGGWQLFTQLCDWEGAQVVLLLLRRVPFSQVCHFKLLHLTGFNLQSCEYIFYHYVWLETCWIVYFLDLLFDFASNQAWCTKHP